MGGAVTVGDLKRAIHETAHIPPDEQRLTIKGAAIATQLENVTLDDVTLENEARTLVSFDLAPGSVVHLEKQDPQQARRATQPGHISGRGL